MKTIKLANGTQIDLFSDDQLTSLSDRYVIGDKNSGVPRREYPYAVLGDHVITVYSPPDTVTKEDKLDKLKEVNAIADAKISVAISSYPDREIDTFSKQLSEALAHKADVNAPVPMISAIAAARGVSVAYLADRIIINSDNFSAYCGVVIGHRQKLETLINNATKFSELQAIDITNWPI